jgi:hypothetical protein
MFRREILKLIPAIVLILFSPYPFLALLFPVRAGDQPARPPIAIDWSATSLLSVNDDWSGVVGVEGFLGQNLTTQVGADPRTLLTTSALAGDRDLIANQANPNGTGNRWSGRVRWDHRPNDRAAGVVDGRCALPLAPPRHDRVERPDDLLPVTRSRRVVRRRGSAGSAAVSDWGERRLHQYCRGYVADATSGPGLATLETRVSAALPEAAANRALVQLRIITANALGNDEWVGIDDIVVATGDASRLLSIDDVARSEGDTGTTSFGFTVRLSAPAGADGVSFDIGTVDGTARAADGDYTRAAHRSPDYSAGQLRHIPSR